MSKKIKCLIVDDEPVALSLMEKYVAQTPFLELTGKCSNAFDALPYLEGAGKPDLLFLDIHMPELNGLQLSKTLPADIKVIFTTAFDQFALESYKVNALDYLLKPFDYPEFLTAAQKAREWYDLKNRTEPAPADQPDYFFIKSEYRHVKVMYDQLLYIEGLKDYAKIYITGEPKPVLSLISLKKLEEELPPDRFMRIHRSFIIALDRIDSIERGQVIIGSRRITVADQYKKQFDKFLQNRSFNA